jgi:hypothetical protein
VTQVSALVNAVILLPVGAAIDGIRARLGLLHGERRGYKLVGIVHDWETALIKTRAKEAQVVIIPDPADFDPNWTPRVEYVGDETQELARYGRIRNRNDGPGGDSRSRRPGPIR